MFKMQSKALLKIMMRKLLREDWGCLLVALMPGREGEGRLTGSSCITMRPSGVSSLLSSQDRSTSARQHTFILQVGKAV